MAPYAPTVHHLVAICLLILLLFLLLLLLLFLLLLLLLFVLLPYVCPCTGHCGLGVATPAHQLTLCQVVCQWRPCHKSVYHLNKSTC